MNLFNKLRENTFEIRTIVSNIVITTGVGFICIIIVRTMIINLS